MNSVEHLQNDSGEVLDKQLNKCFAQCRLRVQKMSMSFVLGVKWGTDQKGVRCGRN